MIATMYDQSYTVEAVKIRGRLKGGSSQSQSHGNISAKTEWMIQDAKRKV